MEEHDVTNRVCALAGLLLERPHSSSTTSEKRTQSLPGENWIMPIARGRIACLLVWLLFAALAGSFHIGYSPITRIMSLGLREVNRGNFVSHHSAHKMLRAMSLKMSAVESNPFYKGMDAYQILGVPRSATKKEIKSAYKKLVAQWHPDKFPDDKEKKKEGGLRMEKINRAYYCLEDEDRRRRYDTYGEQVSLICPLLA